MQMDLSDAEDIVETHPCSHPCTFERRYDFTEAISDTIDVKSELTNEGSDMDSDDDIDPEIPDPDIPSDDQLEETYKNLIDDAQRSMDYEIDLLPISNNFVWEEDFGSFQGKREIFTGPTPGSIKEYDTPYDAFIDIWDCSIMENITRETNRYANQTFDKQIEEETLKSSSRMLKWSDTDMDEMYTLFAVFIYMGIDIRTSVCEYWKGNSCIEMPKFRKVMPYNRYVLLNKCLHFVNNRDGSQNCQRESMPPKLWKLLPVIQHLNLKFSELYNVEPHISIDESLNLFNGRQSWFQTIRNKAARSGIKSYELCESRTGYMHKFHIYTGKNAENSVDLGRNSAKVMLELLENLQHRGHCVTMTNFYNSPALARYLKSIGFDCLGTLRGNRNHVPSDISQVASNIHKGTIVARHSGDVSLLAWKDSRVVTMISTYHDDETVKGNSGKLAKPISLRDYNTLGGNLKDQKLSMYLVERKRGLKWYIKMFKRLLNASIHNAYITLRSSLIRRNLNVLTHREFRYNLAEALVTRHCKRLLLKEMKDKTGLDKRLQKEIIHEPKYVSGQTGRRRCYVCYRQGVKKMVHTQCATCEESLCFENCWKVWHSLPVLEGEEFVSRKRGRRQ